MWADDKQLGVGGSTEKGIFALHIQSDLYRGTSYPNESYENETLSKNVDFKCRHIEVWSLDD